MSDFRTEFVKTNSTVLDVGSQDVNGSYRPLFEDCIYTGLDQTEGKNVDVVTSDPYKFPFDYDSFDVVISGQCLEHSPRPWLLVQEIARVLRPGGACCIIAPWEWEIHRYPVDCFRILPDGMRSMMADAGLTVVRCEVFEKDTIGIGRK